MMIYLLTSGEYEDYEIHGAFASMEDAKRAKVLWGFDQDESAQVEELEVLRIPELPEHNKTPFEVKIHAKVLTIPELHNKTSFKVKIHARDTDAPVYVSKGWVGISSIEEGYSFLGDVYRFYVYAVDEEDAKKKAISYFHTLSKLVQEEQWYPL